MVLFPYSTQKQLTCLDIHCSTLEYHSTNVIELSPTMQKFLQALIAFVPMTSDEASGLPILFVEIFRNKLSTFS